MEAGPMVKGTQEITMTTDTRKQQLESIIEEAYKELSEIKAQKRRRANEEFVGRCFKDKFTDDDGEASWMYSRMIALGSYGYLQAIEFELPSRGRIIVQCRSIEFDDLKGLTEIPQQEFDQEFHRILDSVSARDWGA